MRSALIIASSSFVDTGLASLKAPAVDARALTAVLAAPELGAFDVNTLIDEPRSRIEREIETFFTKRAPDDLLLLYFSGHGIRDDEGQLFLAVRDSDRSMLHSTAIAASFVTRMMDRSRSKRQVLILDCCHSGAFVSGMKGNAAPGSAVATREIFEGTGYGRVVLTASDSTQYAWDGNTVLGTAESSLFTHFLVEGIRTGDADRDGDGIVAVDELYDYVYERVIATTPTQTPGKWTYKQQGEISIASAPQRQLCPAKLPEEIQSAAASPLARVREAVVEDLAALWRGGNRATALAAELALKQLAGDDSRRVAQAAAAALSTASVESLPPAIATPVSAPAIQAAPAASAPEKAPETPIAAGPFARPMFTSSAHMKSVGVRMTNRTLILVMLALLSVAGIIAVWVKMPSTSAPPAAVTIQQRPANADTPAPQPVKPPAETHRVVPKPNSAARPVQSGPSSAVSRVEIKPGSAAARLDGVLNTATPPVAPLSNFSENVANAMAAPASSQPIKVGGNVQRAKLVRQVKPQYPPVAKAGRIQGTVHLIAVIAKDGAVQSLTVVSGDPLLIPAATEAVKQWMYQPTMLNGEPVEVMTTVDVSFTLSQ